MSILQKRTVYSGTPNQINRALTDFITEKYQYTPNLSVIFNTELWLPVEVTVAESDSEEFKVFWKQLQYDLFAIKSKHTDDEFELGDKLLQMLFSHPIVNYTYEKSDAKHYEYIYDNDGTIYISVDEMQPTERTEELTIKTKHSHFDNKFERFPLTKNDFVTLENESLSIIETFFSPVMDFFSLKFTYQENEHISLVIYYSEGEVFAMDVNAHAYCSTIEMMDEMLSLLNKTTDLMSEKLASLSPIIKPSREGILLTGYPITYFNGLTMKENAILSLCKIHGLSYEEVKDVLQLSNKKSVDNTIHRILKKASEGVVGEEVRIFFPGYFDKAH